LDYYKGIRSTIVRLPKGMVAAGALVAQRFSRRDLLVVRGMDLKARSRSERGYAASPNRGGEVARGRTAFAGIGFP
jgi:hypothetical protein